MLKRFLFFSFFSFFSCNVIDCPKLAELYRQDHCIIVAKEFPDKESSYNFEIVGTSPTTQRDTIFKEDNRWFCSFYNFISAGDTVIKHKGELIFNVHKKDTILRFKWDCEGKIYN